jgi:RNA polymerase sigma-70 factor, ECF subfamily
VVRTKRRITLLSANAIYAIPLATAPGVWQREPPTRNRCQCPAANALILVTRMADYADMDSSTDFEGLVSRYYRPLFQFSFSLTRNESEARDLTQQTFLVWGTKGHQLRDASKVKTWLFSTLHHEFLKSRRRQTRFPHYELEQVSDELPVVSPSMVDQMDAKTVVEALGRVDDVYQAPLALFYMEEHSYKEIAEILEVPLGTVESRIARGKAQLQKILLTKTADAKGKEPRG